MSITTEAVSSRIYRGTLRHRRFTPRHHAFSYQIWMAWLDLDELPALFDGVPGFSARRTALARFRREDYLGPTDIPLKDAVRAELTRQLGSAPDGRIFILTQLRTLGVVFNPITLYYVYDCDDRLAAVLGEVTNMPWRERTAYACTVDPKRHSHAAIFAKRMHVSPFNPMDMTYRWRFNTPGEQLLVHMENWHNDPAPDTPPRQFDATLTLTAAPATRGVLLRTLARQPWLSLKTLAGIHFQALKLWLKRVPLYDHSQRKEIP
ncbi:DUF1365 domain-containing protein [Vreelandella salicampi]|uniref:DUF1365 domain-containing protein n=1 Tax=Vreelandella salicampi TaxID=1449798 RepID=A0A7Z0LIX7_9GAMM|nr:DUF1365 domain-containing protein [Halomonas salicampi]NYS59743.1 DUF1365 domain-containing protein [Halomonas salicampi]